MGSHPPSGVVDTAPSIVVGELPLTIDDIVSVAQRRSAALVTPSEHVRGRVDRAHALFQQALDAEQPVYGVTTRFGGMADGRLERDDAIELQNRALWAHKTGAGDVLPAEAVRAAMLVRMSSHLRGHSGVRLELVERLARFLNEDATPRVREFGSIGSSGDLVPLSYICGCIVGAAAGYEVDFRGEIVEARDVLARLGLEPLELGAKEGLAMMNGTSLSTGMSALFFSEARTLLAGSLVFHAFVIQSLAASREYFSPFLHDANPHPGQQWVARRMSELLRSSTLCVDAKSGVDAGSLVQDRYSVRCIPQYIGPLVEELALCEGQVEVEANGASDNPLVDADGHIHHGGNFFGQYIAQAVDRLRYALAMLAKHMDTQIALLMTPEFSNGLPPSLVGNETGPNIGLKGLQLTGNSIVPLLLHRAMPIADRFPTHAEQFNQNVNSQSLAACLLCRESLHAFRQYLAVALLVGVQALDLRAERAGGSHDPRPLLSAPTRRMYEAVTATVGRAPDARRPYVWDDDGQSFDEHIDAVVVALRPGGACSAALDAIGVGSFSQLLSTP